MSTIPRHRALSLLSECTGDDIWSIEHCRVRRVPELWIGELADAFESGYRSDQETIYTDQGMTNQYQGVRDVDLAIRLAAELGIRISAQQQARYSRQRLVQAIKDSLMAGDDEL